MPKMTTKKPRRPSGVRVTRTSSGGFRLRTYGPEAPDLRTVVPGLLDTNPGYLNRQSWEDVVGWLCHMRPLEIDLLTTV